MSMPVLYSMTSSATSSMMLSGFQKGSDTQLPITHKVRIMIKALVQGLKLKRISFRFFFIPFLVH